MIAQNPDAIDARFERASLLRERGSFEEAKCDYLELLRRVPDHFGGLNDLGTLLLKAGFKQAAHTAFSEAIRRHPDNPMGHVNLGNLLFLDDQPEQAGRHFEAALKADADHVHAHRGMGNVLAAAGDMTGARCHFDRGFRRHFLTRLPYCGDSHPVSVLLLVSAFGGNIPTGTILDDRVFETAVLVAEYADRDEPLPPHDLVFDSIGDADLCGEGLTAACSIVRRTRAPVINHPSAVLETGRKSNAERLGRIPGVRTPRMISLSRDSLTGPDAPAAAANNGFAFPLLLRAPGFHTGQNFVRVERAADLGAAAAALPGDTLWLIELLDARGADGKHRKYRSMIVGGRLYPLHLAVSSNWKVHYFRSEMADSAAHRSEDAAFLNDMAAVVGARGMVALDQIRRTLALDYGGIDFAIDRKGDILLFEANATMVMVPLTADPKWDYRRPAFDQVFGAIHTMLTERSAAHHSMRASA